MNSQDIYNIIFDFINNSNYKAILIDGPWGCGKSFQALKVLQEYNKVKDKNKMTLVSVFGYETIDEIHTHLYTKLYPTKATAKKLAQATFGIISKAIDLIPNANVVPVDIIKNMTDVITNEIDNNQKEKIKAETIVILDDIERLSKKIDYQNFYGYINNLIDQGLKIICICDSSKITDNTSFMQFKEKIFERIYKINTPTINVIKSIFKNYNNLLTKQIIDKFDSNLRLANKVYTFFNEVILKLNESYKNYTEKYSYEFFLICCINIIKEEFSIDYKKDIKNDELEREELTKCLKSIYYHNDYNEIDSLLYLYKNDIQEKFPNILKKSFFLLSDKSKENYIKDFLKIIYNKSIPWNYGLSFSFKDILMYSNYEFNDNELSKISKYIDESNINEDDNYIWNIETLNKLNGCKFNKTVNKIKENLANYKIERLKKNLINFYNNKNYSELVNYLYILEQSLNENIAEEIEFIKNNNFFFPNIENDVDEKEWQYCLELSYFFKKFSYENNEFLEYLESLEKDNSKNKSLKDRIELLKSLN